MTKYRKRIFLKLFLFGAMAIMCCSANAETAPVNVAASQIVYDDATINGWQTWGWAREMKFDNAAPVKGGKASIAVKPGGWEAIYFHHDAFDNSAYEAIEFWIHGGEQGGQQLRVQANVGGEAVATSYLVEALKAGEWRRVVIPLKDLKADKQAKMTGFWIQNRTPDAAAVFYLDDISLAVKADEEN